MQAISKVLIALAITALPALPDLPRHRSAWMPGSGAISVKLSGAEEVPPVSTPGSGSGSFRVAEDGTITGSVTTKDVQGTMAHIHRGAKGRTGRSSFRSTRTAIPTPCRRAASSRKSSWKI